MSTFASPIHLFRKSVTVQRRSESATNGSPSFSWSNHLTNVQCEIQKAGGAEATAFGGERNRRTWMVFTLPAQDIKETDRIQWTDDSSGSNVSRTLDVQDVTDLNMRGKVLQLSCEEIDGL